MNHLHRLIHKRKALLPILIQLVLSTVVMAGTWRDDTEEHNYIGLASYTPDVCNIYFGGQGSGILIGKRWVLTAAHCLGTSDGWVNINNNGELKYGEEVFIPTFYDDELDYADLALIRLSEASDLTDFATLSTSSDELGKTVLISGHGLIGSGNDGYTGFENKLVSHAGYNVVDIYGDQYEDGIGNHLLLIDLDRPGFHISNPLGSKDPLDYEFMPVTGDSGGPWLTINGATRSIIGISQGTFATPESVSFNGGTRVSKGYYYEIACATRVSTFYSWIRNTVRANCTPPSDIEKSVTDTTTVLTWFPSLFADSYKIYKSSSDSFASATVIGTTSLASYTDTAVSEGDTYYWIQTVTSEADSQPTESIKVSRATTSGDPDDYDLSLSISPANVPVDGESLATVVATVTENGSPKSGVNVTFSRPLTAMGGWADAYGNSLSDPNNGTSDSSGKRITYYIPNTIQLVTLNASCDGDSASASFNAVGDTGADASIAVSLNGKGDGYADYHLEGRFTSSSGLPIREGTARFTTSKGTFLNGTGAPGSTVTDEISNWGSASATLRVYSEGNVTVSTEYLEGQVSESQNINVSFASVPSKSAHYYLKGKYNAELRMLAGGLDRLVAMEWQYGLKAWDMYTFEQIQYWDEDDYDNDFNDVLGSSSECIGMSRDSDVAILVNEGDYGAFYPQTGNATLFADRSKPIEPEGIAVHPNGSQFADSGDDDDRVDIYDISGSFLRSVCTGYQQYDLDYSPDGSRLAVSARYNDPDDPNPVYLFIYNTSSWNQIARVQVTAGTSPGGVSWSPDSQKVAISTGDDSIQIYDRNGTQSGLTVTEIPLNDDPEDLEWSPDGNYIAAHMGRLAILDSATGSELVSCTGISGDTRDFDTIAWRGDSKVIFATRYGRTSIGVFCPFDNEAPDISASADTYSTSNSWVGITGTVSDEIFVDTASCYYVLNGQLTNDYTHASNGQFTITASNLVIGANEVVLYATDIAGNQSGKEITVTYSPQYVVDFNLGAHATRTGGGALSQTVSYGAAAIVPTLAIEDGYQLEWDTDFSVVTTNLTATAQYQRESHTLAITSEYDACNPSVGSKTHYHGVIVTNTCPARLILGTRKYVCAGWKLTGGNDVSGHSSGTNLEVIVSVEADLSLQWNWSTNFWVDVSAGIGGSVNQTSSWNHANAQFSILATPDQWYEFTCWSGDVSGTDRSVQLNVTSPLQISASFAEKLFGEHSVPHSWLASMGFAVTDENVQQIAESDQDGDGYSTSDEYFLGTSPTNKSSRLEFELLQASKTNTLFSVSSKYGRKYNLYSSTNLTVEGWEYVDGKAGNNSNLIFNAEGSAPGSFYRIRVEKP